MLRFQTFRVMLSTVLALTAATSMFLGLFFSDAFLRRGFGWLLVAIEAFSGLRSISSVVRKPLLASPQPVASEAIGLFVLFPFQLIIILVISGAAPRGGFHVEGSTILKGFAICSAVIHLAYAIGLIAISALTVTAYDGDVWLRDIDSCPSPFPPEILFAFACPWLARRFASTRAFVPQRMPSEPAVIFCLPGCSCLGGHRACSKMPSPHHSRNGHQQTRAEEWRKPPVLAHTLIRIPNAIERRSSIVLELPLEP